MNKQLEQELIKLGATNPEYRKHIRPLLAKLATFGKAEVPTVGDFLLNFFLEASSLALPQLGYTVRKQNANGLETAITYCFKGNEKYTLYMWLGGIKAQTSGSRGSVSHLQVSFELVPPAIENDKGITPGEAIEGDVVIIGETRVEVLAKRIAAELKKAGA